MYLLSEGEKGRFLSAGLRTINSWTDTSIDPVGPFDIDGSEHGEPRGRSHEEQKLTGRLEWSGLELTRPSISTTDSGGAADRAENLSTFLAS